ncbi:hypothetical protein [Solibacillus sp. FSL H8-0538]|uniref:hypothetical protein n=1 Tax=Solibacillus sp. FSL H8-0538 TaxID=2921400 RepID=UPI0030F77107
MKAIEVRQARKELKTKRLAILQKLDELQASLKREKDKAKRKMVLQEIKRCGKLLEQKVLVHVDDHPFKDQEEYKMYASIGKERELSVNVYLKLKQRGFSDKEVAEIVGMPKSAIDKWKVRHGINRSMWKVIEADA